MFATQDHSVKKLPQKNLANLRGKKIKILGEIAASDTHLKQSGPFHVNNQSKKLKRVSLMRPLTSQDYLAPKEALTTAISGQHVQLTNLEQAVNTVTQSRTSLDYHASKAAAAGSKSLNTAKADRRSPLQHD